MSKTICFNNQEKNPNKVRAKIQTKIAADLSGTSIIGDHSDQVKMINKVFLGENFEEKKFLLSELKIKVGSYKQQDIKKDLHEQCNLITLENVIEKLVSCKLKCYYCNEKVYILFDKVRDCKQWTLDRLNNYDEHTDQNTVISCLQCNLQRRRKNSEKFKFTKQLETKQITIEKTG